jgi:hypothetical protein
VKGKASELIATESQYPLCTRGVYAQEEARLVASGRRRSSPSQFDEVGSRPQCFEKYEDCTVYSCLVVER